MSKPKIITVNDEIVKAYTTGLRDGAERERRALRRWIASNKYTTVGTMIELSDWLASRKTKSSRNAPGSSHPR